MLVVILTFVLVISYIILIIEKGDYTSNFLFQSITTSFNSFSFIVPSQSNVANSIDFSNESNAAYNLDETKLKVKHNIISRAKSIDEKILSIKSELKNNLKHLEFILAIEGSLANLASKDRCSLERLEEYLKLKKLVQLKIIELSQSITYFQSKKMNLC